MYKIFLVRRAKGQVLTSPSTYTPLRTFFEDHFEAKSYLDSQVIHDPEKLFAADGTEKMPLSCEGLVEALSEDLLRFRFSNLHQPSLLLEVKEKRRTETDAWLEEQEEARWLRRRNKRMAKNRADSEPTRFVARK